MPHSPAYPPAPEYALREAQILAPYATHSVHSAGRVHAEPPHPYRSPFQRDRDRIVHSAAYRRLSHKTQVFTGALGDYHRSRLTHTHEVASVARTLARALRVNEDLTEALALGHDIGHPPFGHAGEEVLDQRLARHGGFNHNRQAVRIFELIETRYPDFRGLNLSREVLDAQARRADKSAPGATLEEQIVDAADGIAYCTHDADDALELGMLDQATLAQTPLWAEAARRVGRRHAALAPEASRRATLHELLDWRVSDLLGQTRANLAAAGPASPADVARAGRLVAASAEVEQMGREMGRFLFDRVYRHPKVLAHRMQATAALGEMHDRLAADPTLLPASFAWLVDREGPARAAADYLSSITDRFALEEHRRLC